MADKPSEPPRVTAQEEAVEKHQSDGLRTIACAVIAATGILVAVMLLPFGWALVVVAGIAGSVYLAVSLGVLK